MNGYLFLAAFSMLLGGIFSIATSSIAIQCYNTNEKTKTEKQSNFNFLISNLVCAIILIIVGCICIYFAFKPSQRITAAGEKLGLQQFVLSPEQINKQLAASKEAGIAQYIAQQNKEAALKQLAELAKNNPALQSQLALFQ